MNQERNATVIPVFWTDVEDIEDTLKIMMSWFASIYHNLEKTMVNSVRDFSTTLEDFTVLEHKSPKSDMSQSPRGPNFIFHGISWHFMP